MWTDVHMRGGTGIPYRQRVDASYSPAMQTRHADEIAKRIKGIVKQKGKSARSASLDAGLSEDFISKMSRRGSVPELGSLLKLADSLRVPVVQFFEDDAEMANVSVYDVQAAAGDGVLIVDEAEAGQVSFSRPWLRTLTPAAPEQLSIIQAYGDSMEPTIPESAWVMVDRTQTRPINRQIYVFRHGDDARVKRFLIHPTTGVLTLRSDNPSWEDIEVQDPSEIDVIGRVVWFSKKMV